MERLMEVDNTSVEDPSPSNNSEPEVKEQKQADLEPQTTEVETQKKADLETPMTEKLLTNGVSSKKDPTSVGVYLDATVVPILQSALVNLNSLRPADPVQFLIDYLLRHKAQYSKSKGQPVQSNDASSTNQAP